MVILTSKLQRITRHKISYNLIAIKAVLRGGCEKFTCYVRHYSVNGII